MGDEIYLLRKKIQEIKSELNSLGNPPKEKPELIENTNLIRINEHLSEVNGNQTKLISAYEEYTKKLENMLLTVFEIQDDLKNLLREQSKLISTPRKTSSKRKKKK